MAKRSDFAQKLLDDLRLRKERLATSSSSQSSNRTTNTAVAAAAAAGRDAYALAKRNYRGSRELKTGETAGFRTGAARNRSSGGSKSFTSREAAKQIVPYGGGRSSEQIGDLSRALTFAIENGSKLTRMDSSGGSTTMLAFLNQLGRGSMDYAQVGRRNMIDRRHRPSTSNFPTFSHVHIEEISRGAQKLNQILRACSHGLNFDRYSIEIGKELLKGAVDLEESLRMLVNLQEASEYMISPQRKSRITLLDEDEDEEDSDGKIAAQRQLDLPRFSFDKRSRNYHDIEEVARNDLKVRLAALTYPSEATSFIYEKQSASHKRSASTSSQPKGEKVRIPNVIAKLMGLEELPENEDSKYTSQKDSGSKQKVQERDLKKTVQGSSKNAKKRTVDSGNLAHLTAKAKLTQTNKIPAARNDNVALQAERNLAARNDTLEMTSTIVDRLQSNVTRSNVTNGRVKDVQEKQRELKGREKSKMKEPISRDELQLMAPHLHKRSQSAVLSPTENVYPNKLLNVAQGKSQNDIGLQQQPKLQNLSKEAEWRAHQNAKQKKPIRKQKGSEPIFTALSKSRHHEIDLEKKQSQRNQAAASKKSLTDDVDAVGRHHGDIASNRNSINLNANTKVSASRNPNQDISLTDLQSKLAKPKAAMQPPPPIEKKPVLEPDTWKAESIKLQKVELPRKINEVMIRRGGNLQSSGKSPKHQHSILQEMKQRSDKLSGPKEARHLKARKSKETELSIIKSKISVASIQPSTAAEQLKKEAEHVPNLHSPAEDESQSLKETQTLSPDDSCPEAVFTLMKDQQFKHHIAESNSMDGGTHEGITDVSYTSQLEWQKVSKPETPAPLTESENDLKQILVKSQVFLHTAEALFKLNMPYGILYAGGLDCQDEDSKLILDCGYEVMKRKGRMQELSVHPFIKVSMTTTKVRSLDELVKELYKDIGKLKLYGRNGNAEVAIEDYLPKMLELDVYNKDPDVNCMWDLSWNEMMFAFIEKDDVVRDVERSVLNGLVDEITTDLYRVQVQAFCSDWGRIL